ncbi:MAG TPA: response regulator [Bacteroidota bacterium]|nr:response regulator [Bacteroidota bacterium]
MAAKEAIQLLLVTNSHEDVRSAERAAAKWGCMEYWQAVTLAEALKRVAADRFDIVLLSLSLPDSSGIETLIRFNRTMPSIPVIVLTDPHHNHVGSEALRHGALLHLVRGEFSSHMLAQCVRYVLERQRLAVQASGRMYA